MLSVRAALLLTAAICGAESDVLVGSARFAVESTVVLNDVQRRDRDLGYKIKAELGVAPVWSRRQQPSEYLLRFHLHEPKLYLKGKHMNAEFLPYNSILDSHGESTFYAHIINGFIKTTYVDPKEIPDILNYKQSLISLFQFQTSPGEHNETDVSGNCHVLYETLHQNVFRKIKRACAGDGTAVRARRVTRYSLVAGALGEVHAEEVLALGHDQDGLKARSWITLRALVLPPPPSPTSGGELVEAVKGLPHALRPADSLLVPALRQHLDEYKSLEAAVELNTAALRDDTAGTGGDAEAALALLRLVPVLQEAALPALRDLLRRDHLLHQLTGLSRALGLAGTSAALHAADDILQLRSEDPVIPHALLFFEGFALADTPQPDAVTEVLRIGAKTRAPSVVEAALLAAGAAARTTREPVLGASVRDSLVRALAACASDECRRIRILALGNMRRADTAQLLVEQAEREGSGSARLAALQALEYAPLDSLNPDRLDRLSGVALNHAAPLEVRAAALDLVVRRRARRPAPLVAVARELHARGPHELRRIFWQRLGSLAPRYLTVRQFLAAVEPGLRTWDARAHAGSSTVLERDISWAAGGWSAALGSVQLADSGVLRRGLVSLSAAGPNNATEDVLGIEVWTRGIESLTGAKGTAEGVGDHDQDSMAGGLALSVAGTRMRGITLFSGQADLLGHVWAGTGSTPTPVMRALWLANRAKGEVALIGGVWLRHQWRSAVALGLDGHAQVSLWWRTARCQLELRAGGAAQSDAVLLTEWGEVRARALQMAEPRLRVAADLDFYGPVALCVRVATDGHELARNVSLASSLGRKRVRRSLEVRAGGAGAGRTLALGAPNDSTCRSLRAADADTD